MSNHFNKTGALRPRRTQFDLSYRKNFTCDMGQLIPVLCDEVVPGDYWKIGNEIVVRFQPLAAPLMHEVSVSVHYFFVPYRILWDSWEDFISQGTLSGGASGLSIPLPLARLSPPVDDGYAAVQGTLWDFFGFPVAKSSSSWWASADPTTYMTPIDFPWRAYNTVYNEYYRDENLQSEVPIYNNTVLNRNWKKDYFTSALPFRQKGTPPALPVNTAITFGWGARPNGTATSGSLLHFGSASTGSVVQGNNFPVVTAASMVVPVNSSTISSSAGGTGTTLQAGTPMGVWTNEIGNNLVSTADPGGLSATASSSTFNVSDLRLAFQSQKWLERNARGGTRYTEFLRSHFGVSPSDARLDRPEYIGGTKQPVIFNEVLQTSETSDTAQGNMSGHGLSASGQFAGSYGVEEFGLIIGLMSIMPKPSYQNQINRQWLRRLPTDFYFPEFAHLSEQGIYTQEVNFTFGNTNGSAVFGFTGQYDEMRVKNDMVCNEMRALYDPGNPTAAPDYQLSYWNLTRRLPPTPAALNSAFITCVPAKEEVFLVSDVPGLIVNVQNLIHAARPMPEVAEPGLIDHF